MDGECETWVFISAVEAVEVDADGVAVGYERWEETAEVVESKGIMLNAVLM
jgi:hypothetical protein